MKKINLKMEKTSKSNLLTLAVGLFSCSLIGSCAANLNTTDTSKITNVNNNLKGNSIAFVTSSQLDESGIKPISQYKIPSGVDIKDISVAEASLDGRALNKQDISLGLDNSSNIVFFISKSAFETSFAGKTEESNLSIHNSDTFEKKKQELRTQLLQQYKDTLREDTDVQIATPDFLKVKPRGEALTRVQVASLKKDAAKLAKENLFLDRNLYIVLQIGSDKFSVKANEGSTSKLVINKFNIDGSEIKKLVNLQNNPNEKSDIYALPVVAEKVSKNDSSFFENVSNINDSKKIIEAEEIEEALELEVGQEIAKTTKNLREVDISLDLNDIKNIEAKNPQLAVDSISNSKKDDSLDIALQKAKTSEQSVISDFQKVGHKPIPDSRLFDPNKILEDIFKDFDNKPAQSKFTYSRTTDSLPPPSNPTADQMDLKNKELDYPFPGNIVIELDSKFSDTLKNYTLAALTNNNTIFPVSTYIIKNGYLVMDVHTFKSSKMLRLYLLNKEDKGALLTISSDQYFDFAFGQPNQNSPQGSQGQQPPPPNTGSSPKDLVQKVDDNAAAEGKAVTSVDNGNQNKPVNFTEGPRFVNVDPKNLKFTLTENIKLSSEELKKLNVYEEIFSSGGSPPQATTQNSQNQPCPTQSSQPNMMPPQGQNGGMPPQGPPPQNGMMPPPPPGQRPPQGPPPQQGQQQPDMTSPCQQNTSGTNSTTTINTPKRTVIPLPLDKNGNKQGYILVNDGGAIIGFVAEKDFVKDANTTILEENK